METPLIIDKVTWMLRQIEICYRISPSYFIDSENCFVTLFYLNKRINMTYEEIFQCDMYTEYIKIAERIMK